MNREQFGLRLKELRIAAGMSQKELAEAAGVAQSTIAQLEQGRYEPSFATVLALAEALGRDCRAFAESPATDVKPSGRGRPRKPADGGDAQPKRRRQRAR
jgi:transcriptional regulator with XRE-family HTH domain